MNSNTRIATPKFPLKRFDHFSMREVKLKGWIEVQVGEESICEDGEQRNRIFGYVVGIDGDQIAMLVADEVQRERLTGVRCGDVVIVEVCHACRAEYSDHQLDLEAYKTARDVVKDLVEQHQNEFDRRYPEFAGEALVSFSLRGEERDDYLMRWSLAREEFANSLIASGRA